MNFGLLVSAAISGIFFAFLGYAYGWSARLGNRILPFLTVFAGVSGILALTVGIIQGTAWGEPKLWALGIGAGVDFVVVILALLKANSLGPASVVWTVTNLALILPVGFSGLFLGEPLYATDVALIGIFLLMLYVFSKGVESSGEIQQGKEKAFYGYSLIVFVTNGTFMILMKYRDSFFHGANSGGYGTIAFLTTFVIAGALHMALEKDKRVTSNEIRAGSIAGLLNGGGFVLQLLALSLPAIVMFPLNQGVSLLGGVVLTSVLMKEKINTYKLLGFLLGALLLTLSVFRTSLAQLIK